MSADTKVITVYIHKGGVGKTTTTINLGQVLGEVYNKKVLIIDHDAQNSLSFLANVDVNQLGKAEAPEDMEGVPTIGYLEQKVQYYGINDPMSLTPEDVLEAIITPEYVESVNQKGVFGKVDKVRQFAFDLLPGVGEDLSLSELVYLVPDTPEQTVFINQPQYRQIGKHVLSYIVQILREVSDYDYILIDCPPSLGILSINALNASDSLIIPTTMDLLSRGSIPRVVDTLESLSLMLPNFKIRGILFNKCTDSKKDNARIEDTKKFADSRGIPVFKTRIPVMKVIEDTSEDERLATQSISKYKQAMIDLAKEIIEQDERGEF